MSQLTSLRNKEKKSCGCKSKAETSGTHGWYGTPTHNTWRTMRERCYLPTHKSWEYYGGKGVTICDEWERSYVTGFELPFGHGERDLTRNYFRQDRFY